MEVLNIEELREKLYRTIEKFGISSKQALEISQELDLELNKVRQAAAN